MSQMAQNPEKTLSEC